MAKGLSVAPKERINIKFVPATGGEQEGVELPLKVMVLGDFKGKQEDILLEERKAVAINKHTFEAVMQESNLGLQASVKNTLIEGSNEAEDQELLIDLSFNSLSDFSPDSIAKQVPELNKLVELREALVALKGPLGNIPSFRSTLQNLLADEASRNQLLDELKIISEEPSNK